MLRTLANHALELLYPSRCVGCGTFHVLLCEKCVAAMKPAMGEGRCPNCHAAWDGENNCPRCLQLQTVDEILAGFEMDGPARRLVHALKYQHVSGAADVIAPHILRLTAARKLDAIFPVPIHRSREKERGFNQAALIVRAAGWEAAPGLVRFRKTGKQVGMHERQRRANVSGAFRYQGPPLSGLTVAIIDDVITTGATMQECATVLREAGARRILAVSFARASYNVAAPTNPIYD